MNAFLVTGTLQTTNSLVITLWFKKINAPWSGFIQKPILKSVDFVRQKAYKANRQA